MSNFTVQEYVDLEPFNTLAIPAKARWFATVHKEAEWIDALAFARQQQHKVLVLGGGSNVLLPNVYQGLVVRNRLLGVEILEETKDSVLLAIASGENWHEMVMHCVQHEWYGIENLALIPGTVGAAPVQNIGAYGVELEQVFHSLEAINIQTGERRGFDKADCQFAYRNSVFKHEQKGCWAITQVRIRLSKHPSAQTHYPALRQYLQQQGVETPNIKQLAEAVIAIRRNKLPDPRDVPNAGSFFKNPVVDRQAYDKLIAMYPALSAYPAGKGQMKLAAGWLLENAGWKGKIEQGMGMHQQQALVLTNPGHNSRDTLLNFAERVQTSIKQMFDVNLEIEPDRV